MAQHESESESVIHYLDIMISNNHSNHLSDSPWIRRVSHYCTEFWNVSFIPQSRLKNLPRLAIA